MPIAWLQLSLLINLANGGFAIHESVDDAHKLAPCDASLVCEDHPGAVRLTRHARKLRARVSLARGRGAGDPEIVDQSDVLYLESDAGRCRVPLALKACNASEKAACGNRERPLAGSSDPVALLCPGDERKR